MLLALVFFSALLRISVAERSNLTRTYEFPETYVETSWPSTDNTNLVYSRCNASLVPGASTECIVGVKFDAFENSTGLSKECKITLKPKLTNAVVKDSLIIRDFGKDKILVVWTEVQNASDAENQIGWTIFRTTVVHMLDSCQNFEAEVHKYTEQPIANIWERCHYMSLVIFKNTYELIMKDAINRCTSESECSLGYGVYKFDSRGRKLSGPDHWPDVPLTDAVRHVSSAGFKEAKEGYFISSLNDTSQIVELMDKESTDHKKIEVWKLSSNETIREYRYSFTNEAIGLGYVLGNSSVGCWQADQEGKIHIQKQFSFPHPYNATLPAVYNLRNGGLLLAVNKYANSDSHKHDYYLLMKVSANGQLETVKVHFDNKCTHGDNIEVIRMFENKMSQYCMVRLCQSALHKSGRLDTSVSCYSSDEFSKCIDCV